MLLSAPAATEDEREDNPSLPGSSLCLPTNPQCHSDGGRWCRFQTLGSCNHISCDQCQESGYKIHQVKYRALALPFLGMSALLSAFALLFG